MIVYFTGTGNSRYCAELLAHRLEDTCVSAFHGIRDHIAAELTSQLPWVFVSPTYSWQAPHVFLDYLRSGTFSGSRDAYFVLTCGSDIGNAQAGLQALCKQKGFRCRGVLPVVMPENYIAMFSAPGREEALSILSAARPGLEQAANWIQAGLDFPDGKVTLMDRLKSGPVNALFYRFNVRDKPFTVSDACISCGKCEAACPLGNIRMENGRPVWGGRCTHCMACICGCPTEAIEYGRVSRGKPRYQCPPYQS